MQDGVLKKTEADEHKLSTQAACHKKWMLETAAWVDLNQELPYDGFSHSPLNHCSNIIIYCVPILSPLAPGYASFCCTLPLSCPDLTLFLSMNKASRDALLLFQACTFPVFLENSVSWLPN